MLRNCNQPSIIILLYLSGGKHKYIICFVLYVDIDSRSIIKLIGRVLIICSYPLLTLDSERSSAVILANNIFGVTNVRARVQGTHSLYQ